MTYANQVKNTLIQEIADMTQTPWLFSKSPETDFARNRKINFHSLIHLCICMEGGSMPHELLKYFSYDSSAPTNSAFYQQRSKLFPETFPFLFQQFVSYYQFSLYKGKYQLLACDGSSFTFTRNPSDPDSYFAPDGKTTNGYNQIHVVTLFDLLSKRYRDAVVRQFGTRTNFRLLQK